MKTGKNARQELILRLIREKDISTQEDLTRLVREAGFEATQATCSRDIKELGIIKITLPNKTTKYAVLDRTGDVAPGRLLAVFSNSLVSVQAEDFIHADRVPDRLGGCLDVHLQISPPEVVHGDGFHAVPVQVVDGIQDSFQQVNAKRARDR